MKNIYRIAFLIMGILIVIISGPIFTLNIIDRYTKKIISPIEQANLQISTQVFELLHPTPTIIPDPISIVHEIRSLARFETIQYTIEKVITAELGQEQFRILFGDKLLFVARGFVIAGVDLNKLMPEDLSIKGKILYIKLPEPEIFIATLDNERSYVYDRETGLLTHGDKNLETQARQVAEEQIKKSALEDGILNQAKINAENSLSQMLRWAGYTDIIYIYSTPVPIN